MSKQKVIGKVQNVGSTGVWNEPQACRTSAAQKDAGRGASSDLPRKRVNLTNLGLPVPVE